MVLLRVRFLSARIVASAPVVSYTAVSPFPAEAGGLVSVILSVRAFSLSVIRLFPVLTDLDRHAARWSSDFPHLPAGRRDRPMTSTLLFFVVGAVGLVRNGFGLAFNGNGDGVADDDASA